MFDDNIKFSTVKYLSTYISW